MNYWLSLFVLLSMLPVSANAYVCSRVTTPNGPDTGPSLSWFSRIIPISINEDGTSQLDADQEFQVVEASYRVWERLESDSDTCRSSRGSLQIYDLTLVLPARFARRLAAQSVTTTSHLIQMRTLWYSGTRTGPTPPLVE